jgi:hypothetical protein
MWFAMSAAHKRHFTHVADDEAKLALFVVQVHARQWPRKSMQVHTSLHKSTPFQTILHNVPHTYKGDDDDDDDLYCWVKGGCHKKGVQVIMCSMAAQVHARQWPLKSTQVHTSLHKSTPFRHRDGTLLCLVDISVSCGHKAGDEEQQT